MMIRFISILITFVSTVKTILCADIHNPEKPNLLVLMTDEHNMRTLGCYRDLMSKDQAFVWGEGVKVDTPNIDSLAKEGVIFQNYYANAPVCTPSRASFVSGLYPNATGAWANHEKMYDGTMTFSRLLRSWRNYRTGYMGKWHLDGEEKPGFKAQNNFGWTFDTYKFNRGHWKFMDKNWTDVNVYSWEDKEMFDNKMDRHFTTDYLFDRGVEFIQEAVEKDKNFALMLSVPDPHGPNYVRPPYDTMFDHLTFQVPKTAIAAFERNPARPSWGDFPPIDIDFSDVEGQVEEMVNDESRQKKLRLYFGMVKCIDDNVGKILQAVKDSGLYNNTVVVFTSDHGDLLGEHARENKGNPYQMSASAPLIIRHPNNIMAGKVIRSPATTIDFFPTIISLLNAKNEKTEDILNTLHGIDLSDEVLDDQQITNNNKIRYMTDSKKKDWAAAFTSRYKLVLATKTEPWLFDFKKDPDELYNYYDDPDYSDISSKLRDKLVDEMFKYNFTILLDGLVFLDTPACWNSRNRLTTKLTKTCGDIDFSACSNSKVREECPVFCEDCCVDSTGLFVSGSDVLTCSNINRRADQCQDINIRKFCPVSCGRCGPLTDFPSLSPSNIPSDFPSFYPTSMPSTIPTLEPSDPPSMEPSNNPSDAPSEMPTLEPTKEPTNEPTNEPTSDPSYSPSKEPIESPSNLPSILPTNSPSKEPIESPSNLPSILPTNSRQPSLSPTSSSVPSTTPSTSPSLEPSDIPSGQPSMAPSSSPNGAPSGQPTFFPSIVPTTRPSSIPSSEPSSAPSFGPFCYDNPKFRSDNPDDGGKCFKIDDIEAQCNIELDVAGNCTRSCSGCCHDNYYFSSQMNEKLGFDCNDIKNETDHKCVRKVHLSLESGEVLRFRARDACPLSCGLCVKPPTSAPSSLPSLFPSTFPTVTPSLLPSTAPSEIPTSLPSTAPSLEPSLKPSIEPTSNPSALPSSDPSLRPSTKPSFVPSTMPTAPPSKIPSKHPSSEPSTSPPTLLPSTNPSLAPSTNPSLAPSSIPTALPTIEPSLKPSDIPTAIPSEIPSLNISSKPSMKPSMDPSSIPTLLPSKSPSEQPTSVLSMNPSLKPSQSVIPTAKPTDIPSLVPTEHPSTTAPTPEPCEDSGETFGGLLNCTKAGLKPLWSCKPAIVQEHCRFSCGLCDTTPIANDPALRE